MAGAGVHIALIQRSEHVIHIGKAVYIFHLLYAGYLVCQQQFLRLSGYLHGNTLIIQVGQCTDIAVSLHDDHLPAVHIRPRPVVAILPPGHGEAAPQAVHLSVRKQPVLLLPGYLPEVRRPPQALAGRLGDRLLLRHDAAHADGDMLAALAARYAHCPQPPLNVSQHGGKGRLLHARQQQQKLVVAVAHQ